MDKWIKDPNLWVRRSALLYQLKFRDLTDWERLKTYCDHTAKEEDFFIRKAIGWSLREYAKVNSAEVKRYVSTREFSSLTVREALKNC
jgi:3-methyladenine DNA glycosylase AlkD